MKSVIADHVQKEKKIYRPECSTGFELVTLMGIII